MTLRPLYNRIGDLVAALGRLYLRNPVAVYALLAVLVSLAFVIGICIRLVVQS